MKAQALLALAIPAVLGTPAPLAADADGSTVVARDEDTSCNPYTDWGYSQGAITFCCHNFGEWWEGNNCHCVKYKSADYCSGKNNCDSNNQCTGNGICRWGVCLEKVNRKHCKRTCTFVSVSIPFLGLLLDMLMFWRIVTLSVGWWFKG
jgi:hypothetical protein